MGNTLQTCALHEQSIQVNIYLRLYIMWWEIVINLGGAEKKYNMYFVSVLCCQFNNFGLGLFLCYRYWFVIIITNFFYVLYVTLLVIVLSYPLGYCMTKLLLLVMKRVFILVQFLCVQISHCRTWSWSYKTSSITGRLGGYRENNKPHCICGSKFDCNYKILLFSKFNLLLCGFSWHLLMFGGLVSWCSLQLIPC